MTSALIMRCWDLPWHLDCFRIRALADGLHEGVKLRREDVFINLVEVPEENWSYGNGEAQHVK